MYKEKPGISTLAIVIALFVFFPVGFILLFVRLVSNLKYGHFRSGDYKLAGNILVVIGLLLLYLVRMAAESEDGEQHLSTFIILFILFIVPGILFYLLSARSKRKMQSLYRLYYELIIGQGATSIDWIAQQARRRPAAVMEDIAYMIRSGQLIDAYLNIHGRQVVIGHRTANPAASPGQPDAAGAAAAAAASEPQVQTKTCPGCGATATLARGQRVECEFCGNMLHFL